MAEVGRLLLPPTRTSPTRPPAESQLRLPPAPALGRFPPTRPLPGSCPHTLMHTQRPSPSPAPPDVGVLLHYLDELPSVAAVVDPGTPAGAGAEQGASAGAEKPHRTHLRVQRREQGASPPLLWLTHAARQGQRPQGRVHQQVHEPGAGCISRCREEAAGADRSHQQLVPRPVHTYVGPPNPHPTHTHSGPGAHTSQPPPQHLPHPCTPTCS